MTDSIILSGVFFVYINFFDRGNSAKEFFFCQKKPGGDVSMNQKTMLEIASIRLALIQPAFNGTYPDATKKQYYERVSAVPVKLPDGKNVKYAYGTLACWESDYRKGGFEALIPR